MSIPLYESDTEADSLNLSNDSVIIHDDVEQPIINLEQQIIKPVISELPPILQPVATILNTDLMKELKEIEEKILSAVSHSSCSIFTVLYELHQHFLSADTYTKEDKTAIKNRILTNAKSAQKNPLRLSEITAIIDNFFR